MFPRKRGWNRFPDCKGFDETHHVLKQLGGAFHFFLFKKAALSGLERTFAMKTRTAMRWFLCAMCAGCAVGDTTPLAQGTVEAFRKAVHETGAAGFPFQSENMKMFQWMPFISSWLVVSGT